MHIHVGEEITVQTQDIIAIIDKKGIETSILMDEFIKNRKNQLLNAAKGPYKSVVITRDKVYFSPFSSETLKKRSGKLFHPEVIQGKIAEVECIQKV